MSESITDDSITGTRIERLFTGPEGRYHFARWGRPIVPVVFGVDEATLSTLKGAVEAMVALAGHKMAETDPELGANLMLFFFRDWAELPEVPNLDRLVPDLGPLCARLGAAGANRYRTLRHDETGAIRAVFSFIRMDAALAEMPAEDLALVLAAESLLEWGEGAFRQEPPLARAGDRVILSPVIAGVIRAGYDPVMPVVADDPSHALRLSARLMAG